MISSAAPTGNLTTTKCIVTNRQQIGRQRHRFHTDAVHKHKGRDLRQFHASRHIHLLQGCAVFEQAGDIGINLNAIYCFKVLLCLQGLQFSRQLDALQAGTITEQIVSQALHLAAFGEGNSLQGSQVLKCAIVDTGNGGGNHQFGQGHIRSIIITGKGVAINMRETFLYDKAANIPAAGECGKAQTLQRCREHDILDRKTAREGICTDRFHVVGQDNALQFFVAIECTIANGLQLTIGSKCQGLQRNAGTVLGRKCTSINKDHILGNMDAGHIAILEGTFINSLQAFRQFHGISGEILEGIAHNGSQCVGQFETGRILGCREAVDNGLCIVVQHTVHGFEIEAGFRYMHIFQRRKVHKHSSGIICHTYQFLGQRNGLQALTVAERRITDKLYSIGHSKFYQARICKHAFSDFL